MSKYIASLLTIPQQREARYRNELNREIRFNSVFFNLILCLIRSG